MTAIDVTNGKRAVTFNGVMTCVTPAVVDGWMAIDRLTVPFNNPFCRLNTVELVEMVGACFSC